MINNEKPNILSEEPFFNPVFIKSVSLKSLIGFLGDVQNLEIDWVFLLTFTLISVIGIFIGQLFSQKVAENKLKTVFGLFVILSGLLILLIEFT